VGAALVVARVLSRSTRALVDQAKGGPPARTLVTELNVAARALAVQKEHHEILIQELNHRVKNTLSTIQSIARRTFKGHPITEVFDGRLVALSHTHDLLTASSWEGADVKDVLKAEVQPYAAQVELKGPSIVLAPRAALSVAMATHELLTNALKYGSLTKPDGLVCVEWKEFIADGEKRIELVWQEKNGPEVVHLNKPGFGTTLLRTLVRTDLQGEVDIDYHHPEGVRCRIVGTTGT
jgi:two-component sensor histidine kinase